MNSPTGKETALVKVKAVVIGIAPFAFGVQAARGRHGVERWDRLVNTE